MLRGAALFDELMRQPQVDPKKFPKQWFKPGDRISIQRGDGSWLDLGAVAPQPMKIELAEDVVGEAKLIDEAARAAQVLEIKSATPTWEGVMRQIALIRQRRGGTMATIDESAAKGPPQQPLKSPDPGEAKTQNQAMRSLPWEIAKTLDRFQDASAASGKAVLADRLRALPPFDQLPAFMVSDHVDARSGELRAARNLIVTQLFTLLNRNDEARSAAQMNLADVTRLAGENHALTSRVRELQKKFDEQQLELGRLRRKLRRKS